MINVLQKAFSMLPHKTIYLKRFIRVETAENGLNNIIYSEPIAIEANVQPVDTSVYNDLNLEFGKNYFYVHSLSEIRSLEEQEASDILFVDGKRLNVISSANWYKFNGWSAVLCVEDKTYEG